jgi:hypothetical protein
MFDPLLLIATPVLGETTPLNHPVPFSIDIELNADGFIPPPDNGGVISRRGTIIKETDPEGVRAAKP